MEYSLTFVGVFTLTFAICLNPCSNGVLSDSSGLRKILRWIQVLILILMEYSLTKHVKPGEKLQSVS